MEAIGAATSAVANGVVTGVPVATTARTTG